MKSIKVFVLLLLAVFSSSCSPSDSHVQNAMDFLTDIGIETTQDETVEKSSVYADTILDALKTGKTINLSNMFCEKVKLSHNVDEEIAEAIEFIDGEIVNEGELSGVSESGSSWRNGEKIESYINPRIKQIETDSGKKYNISFFAYIIYENDSSYIGITRIMIRADNDEVYMIGEVL